MNISYIYLLRFHTSFMCWLISHSNFSSEVEREADKVIQIRWTWNKLNLYLLQILLAFIFLGVSTFSFANTHSLIFKVTKLGFSLEAKPAEAHYGEEVTLLAQVEGLQPTGKVIFYNGDQQLGEFLLASEHQGVASLKIKPAALNVGIHRLTAHYFSDKHDKGYEQAEVLVKINAAPLMLNLSDLTVVYAPNQTVQLDKPESPSKGTFSYHIAEDEQRIATVDEHGLIAIHDGGEVTITVKQAAHGNYQQAMGTFKLVIHPGEGGITYIGGDGQVLL